MQQSLSRHVSLERHCLLKVGESSGDQSSISLYHINRSKSSRASPRCSSTESHRSHLSASPSSLIIINSTLQVQKRLHPTLDNRLVFVKCSQRGAGNCVFLEEGDRLYEAVARGQRNVVVLEGRRVVGTEVRILCADSLSAKRKTMDRRVMSWLPQHPSVFFKAQPVSAQWRCRAYRPSTWDDCHF